MNRIYEHSRVMPATAFQRTRSRDVAVSMLPPPDVGSAESDVRQGLRL
jgi:hypothetical protein